MTTSRHLQHCDQTIGHNVSEGDQAERHNISEGGKPQHNYPNTNTNTTNKETPISYSPPHSTRSSPSELHMLHWHHWTHATYHGTHNTLGQCNHQPQYRCLHGILSPHQKSQILRHLDEIFCQWPRMTSTRSWGRLKGTNTVFFIPHAKVPMGRQKDVTYGWICVNYRPQKDEPHRTRLMVGGNLINYPGNVSTPTADTTTTKLVINSTISTPKAKYMCSDIKNFYLDMPMECFEYMWIPIALVPQEIINEYNLENIIHNRYIYMEIQWGMYGLPQVGIIANQLLTKNLKLEGYYQCHHTPGLWHHKWRPILFSLIVDDFRIKYIRKQHVDHLINSIENTTVSPRIGKENSTAGSPSNGITSTEP